MAFSNPDTPNLADFESFLADTVAIPAAALPSGSPFPSYAFNQAMSLVPCIAGIPGFVFSLAVYNCATHVLFTIAPDQPGNSYFSHARGKDGFGINLPWTGLVTASSDNGSSTSLAQPEWAAHMTVGQLGFFRTPWGREYLDYIQKFGPTAVGLT